MKSAPLGAATPPVAAAPTATPAITVLSAQVAAAQTSKFKSAQATTAKTALPISNAANTATATLTPAAKATPGIAASAAQPAPQTSATGADGKAADESALASAKTADEMHRFTRQDTTALPQGDTHATAKTSNNSTLLPNPIQQAATQPPNSTAPAVTTAPPAPPTPPAAPVPLAGIPVVIASKALAGNNHFEIRLDPPELGRIDVRLDVDKDGQITSHLMADRKDTLDLLQRDASGLQRALQDAGLKTAGNGLQFSLREQSSDGNAQRQSSGGQRRARLSITNETAPAIEAAPRSYSRFIGRAGGVDIRV